MSIENVRVVMRIRPLNEREKTAGDVPCVHAVGDSTLQVRDPSQQRALSYNFFSVMGPEASQQEVFERSGAKELLSHVLRGYSATIFAYGPTGSGKTFSIAGAPEYLASTRYVRGEHDGLIARCVDALWHMIDELSHQNIAFDVRTSCMEIYNEQVMDLLSKKAASLPVRFDTRRNAFYVDKLTRAPCKSAGDVMHLFNRGSERLKETKSEGTVLAETGHINKSLFTLGKVISSLCDRKTHKVPYRDSKLTQLLMDSVGGKSLTIMLGCVTPSSSFVHETLRTLEYAARAKNIRNKPVVLLDPQNDIVNSLKQEIAQLREENARLRAALAASPSSTPPYGDLMSLEPPPGRPGSVGRGGGGRGGRMTPPL